jgi:hypothetical protein
MREWISLFENDEDTEFFWYHSGLRQHLTLSVDEDHATAIANALGLSSPYSDYEWNSDIIKQAIEQGWVRGRYGPLAGTMGGLGSLSTLSLQGRRGQVHRVARELLHHRPVSELYVDFADGDDIFHDMGDKHNVRLAGERLEFFLKRGTIPRDTILESRIDDLKTEITLQNDWRN